MDVSKRKSKSFIDKFNDLTDQMTDLINGASEDDLTQIGVAVLKEHKPAPEIPLEVKTEKEFMQNMVYRLTGDKRSFIFQRPDELDEQDIIPFLKSKQPIITPSVIKSNGPRITFNPYITFFTIDGKLAMLPYEGQFFSDLTTNVGKIDPLFYRRGN